MYQYKDLRGHREEYCKALTFDNISIHGDADYREELPDSFNVSFTNSSLQRLKTAWKSVITGVDMSGSRIRAYDVRSSLSGLRVKDAKILLYRVDQNHVDCELQCFCSLSVNCFISQLKLHDSWFE